MIGSRGSEATLNVLSAIETLPQGLADRLPETEVGEFFAFYVFAYENLKWLDALPRTELLGMARNDYEASTSEVLAHRYGQARWAAQQAVEKVIKGLLAIGGTKFPTGGRDGHNLKYLGERLSNAQNIRIESSTLDMAACSPKVRYGEEPSTETQALDSNHAALAAFDQLRRNPRTQVLLARHGKPRLDPRRSP